MSRKPPSERNFYKGLEVGHPALKRESFRALVELLFKLKCTDYVCVPAVSNPYHLMKAPELRVYLEAHPVIASPKRAVPIKRQLHD